MGKYTKANVGLIRELIKDLPDDAQVVLWAHWTEAGDYPEEHSEAIDCAAWITGGPGDDQTPALHIEELD